MTRRLVPLLLVGGILIVGLATGDEPAPDSGEAPLRLKRKKRPTDTPAAKPPEKAEKEPPREPQKPAEKEEEPLVPEDGPPPAADAQDDQEVLERIARNMRAVEDKLGNRELGEPTAQQQRDILRDLESLIKRSEQQQGGGEGQPPPQDQNQGEQDQQQQQQQQGGRQQQKQAGRRQGGGQQMARRGGRRPRRLLRSERGDRPKSGAQRQMAGGQQPRPGPQPQPQPGQAGMNPGKGGNNPGNARDRDVETYRDIWGHLPESLRAEMNAYSNPQPFLPRYDRLIREYYKTIAEQGRRKGD